MPYTCIDARTFCFKSLSLSLPFALCPLSFVLCPLSFVLCPLSFVLCPLSFVLCPLSFVLCPLSFVLVSVSVSWCWQGRAESEKGLSSPVPDQRSSSCFPVCSVGFPAAHLSFVCLSHGGGRLRPSQVWKSRAKSSTQGWSPNSGQASEDESGSLVDVLVSGQGQHSSSSGLRLPQQSQHAGSQTQSVSSMNQLQNGLVQHQPSGSNPEPPTANALGQYQPAGNNETPLARDDLNSDVTVNAQLTHLISRDDAPQGQDAPHVSDVLMPDAPTVHDIATPRRIIGGRCRKWCISAQPASGKRKCAACNLCGIRFTHGEARLQQWGNRETNHHCVHAHCVNGGLGHDHELFPKQATDQDAVDAVTRQRDTITRTAADTEVLLPFAQDPDQASTVAPPNDERDLFGREEALRMDEEIMNLQWFEHVTWDCIKDLRGTTYVQPPTRFRFALKQAQHAILRAIIHNNPTSLASESAWKALVLSSWLLLGRPAVNASERNCAHFLDARLEPYGLRTGLLFGPWYVPNVMLLRCRA